MPRVMVRPAIIEDIYWMMEDSEEFCNERGEDFPGWEHAMIIGSASIAQGLAIVSMIPIYGETGFITGIKMQDINCPSITMARCNVLYIKKEYRKNTDSYKALVSEFVTQSRSLGYIPEFLLDAKVNVCDNTIIDLGLKKKYTIFSG